MFQIVGFVVEQTACGGIPGSSCPMSSLKPQKREIPPKLLGEAGLTR